MTQQATQLPTSILISLSVDDLRAIVKDEITTALDSHSPPVTQDEIMNVKEAAAFLKIPASTIYQMCGGRVIPYYKPGKSLLFKRTELKEWLEGFRK